MQILSAEAPGRNAGGYAPATPEVEVSPDLTALVRITPKARVSIRDSDPERDIAAAYVSLACAADRAAGFIAWHRRAVADRLADSDPILSKRLGWFGYAADELSGLPWCLGHALAVIRGLLPIPTLETAERTSAAVALGIEPTDEPERVFIDTMVVLDHAQTVVSEVLAKHSASRAPRIVRAVRDDLGGAVWAIAAASGCLMSEIRPSKWNAACARQKARIADLDRATV